MTDTQESISASIYGHAYAAKMEQIKAALLDVESKHMEFFRSRAPQSVWEKHDRLRHHLLSYYDGRGTYKLGFNQTSNLPMAIVDDCNAAIAKVMKE